MGYSTAAVVRHLVDATIPPDFFQDLVPRNADITFREFLNGLGCEIIQGEEELQREVPEEGEAMN